MNKALVIVESPAKAKTINKYLGDNYIVKSSIGHIRDLPTNHSINKKNNNLTKNKIIKNKKIKYINSMGIDPYNNWEAKYEILPGKEKIVDELKLLAKKAKHIYLATDLDREGEAIAWHLKEIIGGDHKRFSRIIFNEITKNSIQQAFKKPGELNINRVNAQQARRFMDRIVGYMISPILWKKIARGLSAGRVQSVAMRLIVERERNIKAFIPQEYWKLYINLLTKSKIIIPMKVTHINNNLFKPINLKQIQTTIKLLEKECFTVFNYKSKITKIKPHAPFTTSTLQQAANTYLGFSVKKTMMIAQRLYENGYITYIRTDSTNLSQESIIMVRHYINKNFNKKYLPKSPNKYNTTKNSQEAHEAIRPTDINIIFEQLKIIEIDEKKLYQLIWCQFVACQMTSAQYDCSTLLVNANHYKLCTKGRTLHFDGWTIVIPMIYKKNKEHILPFIKIGTKLKIQKFIPSQHFTKSPSRYNEASLVKELEKRGIGRPSTYASIISTIQNRGYVRLKNHRFYAEKIGEIVTDRLIENFYELMNYNFTANMEDRLDQIALNNTKWKVMLDEFFIDFNKQLEIAKKNPEIGGMRLNKIVITNINCPKCNKKMGIKTAITGVFLSCSSYILKQTERCKTTINLIPEIEILNVIEGDKAETNALRARNRCKKCNTAMDNYFIDNKNKLLICGNNPICDGYILKKGNFLIKKFQEKILKCDKCNYEMYIKIGRFGKYMSCINEHCKNTRKILHNGDIAPPKEDPIPLPELKCKKSNAYFVLRNGSSGIFLAANTFPKSRETRAPLVKELILFKDRLSKKLHYLTDAPILDNVGNMTLVRFNRKNKEQYITSEKNGETTGWFAFYINGKWIENKKNK